MLDLINPIIGTVAVLFFSVLGITSLAEREVRAFWISMALAAAAALVWFLVLPGSGIWINTVAVAGVLSFIVVSFVRFFPPGPLPRQTRNAAQYDERDTMFARNNIQYYPDLMESYYGLRPEFRSPDRQIHAKPEFGDSRQTFHDHDTAPLYDAAFTYLAGTIPLSNGPVAPEKKKVQPQQFAQHLARMVRFYGGCDTGIMPLSPHHYYSHKGRHATDWGDVPDQTYTTAIVIVVPMSVPMLKQGPTACVIQESARQYVEAAKVSNIIAGYIRSFGYRARAHNDANYDTLCVPLAVESGLGELGRMGIFMHRVHGPCVRLAVVTTDMELPGTARTCDLHMEDFCRICKKCADNCPSGSITHGPEQESRGFRHWSIDQEKCFSYWKSIGSDCGVCISVCPYTKPDTPAHRLVRWYISRNSVNQHIALAMDDLLYGRKKPLPRQNPAQIFRS